MGISTQSKTKVNDKAAAPEEKKTVSTGVVAGQEIEDIGGPTPQNYKSTDDSAKIDASKKTSKSTTKVNSGAKPAESGSVLKGVIWAESKEEDDEDEDEDEESSKKSKKKDDEEDEDEDMKEAHGLLKKAAYKLKKEDFTIDIKEDFDALTSGETLTENFKNKAKIIFESAVKKKVVEQLDTIESAYLVSISEEIEEHKQSLLEKVDAFLNYVCEEWLEENQIAVESGLKLEIAENFMEGVKKIFQESYIEVPEAKVDIVDELTEQLEQIQSKLDEQIEKNIQLNKLVESHEKDTLIKEFSEGLADSQKEKFFSLAEALNYDNEESFKDGLKTLKESYFQKTVKTATEDRIVSSQVLTESMDSYVKAISRWSK